MKQQTEQSEEVAGERAIALPESLVETLADQTKCTGNQTSVAEAERALTAKQKRSWGPLGMMLVAGSLIGFIPALLIIPALLFIRPSINSLQFNILSIVSALLSLGVACIAARTLFPRYSRSLPHQQMRSEETRSIAPGLQLLHWLDTPTRIKAIDNLLELLPRVADSGPEAFSDRDLKTLYRWLSVSHNMGGIIGPRRDDLVVAVLDAIARVGDERAIRTVRSLSRMCAGRRTVWAGVDISERVKVAADQCLARLQLRIDEAHGGASLLRSASEPETPEDSLLRAARGEVEDKPRELLRPDVSEKIVG